ncbi:MAG TPA: hypothetical protein PLW93_03290 [Candidatus Absconditabacterales bacterium]|nr:hypothetical protein [Candidatus Absconditabacterales bacterium]
MKKYVDDQIEGIMINQKMLIVTDLKHLNDGLVIIDILQKANEIVSETMALGIVSVTLLM